MYGPGAPAHNFCPPEILSFFFGPFIYLFCAKHEESENRCLKEWADQVKLRGTFVVILQGTSVCSVVYSLHLMI